MTYETYTDPLNGLECIKRTDDSGQVTWIPKDPNNTDYQAYLDSLKAP